MVFLQIVKVGRIKFVNCNGFFLSVRYVCTVFYEPEGAL